MSATEIDTLTILVCAQGFSATKTISPKEGGGVDIKGFKAGAYYRVMTREVSDIEELSQNLEALEAMPNAFVIRGSPIAPIAAGKTIRRKKVNFWTPEAGKRWVLIDFDKLPIPDDIDLAADPKAAIEQLVAQLPAEFHDASYHYQLSSSAGFSAPGTISAHVWFWLAKAWSDEKLKTWAKAVNEQSGCKLIDTALFNDVQAHYTAAPVFNAVTDPFPKRSALVKKAKDAVSICEIKMPERQAPESSGPFETGPGFEGWLARIGDQSGGEGFHEPIIKSIASYVSSNGRDGTDLEALYETIRTRILAADRSKHDDAYVEQMASRDHIIPAITGALQKFGGIPPSRRRSRMIKGLASPQQRDALNSEEAHRQLSAQLDQILEVSSK
jgi:hypothetical protein